MKKYISRILAGAIIAAALIAGNFAGMGAAEVKAAGQNVMVVCVKDENGSPVNRLQLIFSSDTFGDIEFEKLTDSSGEVETDQEDLINILDALEYEDAEEGTFLVKPAEGEGYNCETPIIVHFGIEEDTYYGNMPYIDTVNGNKYNGDTVNLKVNKPGSGTPTVKSEITEVTSPISEIEYAGGPASITVKGTALPDSYDYSLYYTYKGNNTGRLLTNGSIKGTGTDTEKKISLNMPDISSRSDLLSLPTEDRAWRVGISLPGTGYWKYVSIGILDDYVTDKIRTALNSAIAGMSQLKEADYTANSWKVYSDAVEAGKALLEKEDATGTEYRRATDAIEKAKSALVRVQIPVQETKVSKITITGISKKIAAGKKIQLTAKVSPANASNKAVKWTSSNKKYAAVDAKGKVTTKKAGEGKTVTITATAADGSGIKATYKIKIIKSAVKSVSLKAKNSVKAGKSLTVKATVKTTGKNANKTLKWTSSNTKYATVSSKGVVKTKKAGKGKTVKITAKATDGSGKKKTITIKIK